MLKKGDTVVMHTCMEAEGFSGSFQTAYLQKVDVSAYVHEKKQQIG